MTRSLVLPGALPSLNDYIKACRANKYGGNTVKRGVENYIVYQIKQQLRGVRFTSPVTMAYTWCEKDRRRDKDNVAFAKKFIQDALVASGMLRDDGWDYITGFTDDFRVDKDNPRIEVTITEADNEREA